MQETTSEHCTISYLWQQTQQERAYNVLGATLQAIQVLSAAFTIWYTIVPEP